MSKFKQTGFTLLELLVVIVIIGLLAGYVAPRYFSQVGKSEIQVARAQIDAGSGIHARDRAVSNGPDGSAQVPGARR